MTAASKALIPATLIEGVELPADITVDEREIYDLEMLLMGAFAPLQGFHRFEEFCSVVTHSRLVSGAVWPIPIVLPVAKSQIRVSQNRDTKPQTIKLRNCYGTILAEMEVDDCYEPNLEVVCRAVLGTDDSLHPYVSYLQSYHKDCVYVGGKVSQVHPVSHFDFCDLRKTPTQVRREIEEKGWEVVVGFQTRNPLHRSHFELTIQVSDKLCPCVHCA